MSVAELVSVYETGEVIGHVVLNDRLSIQPMEDVPVPYISGKPIKAPHEGLAQLHVFLLFFSSVLQTDFLTLLDHPSFSPFLLTVEQVTGLSRLHLLYSSLAAFAIYLILGPGAQFMSNLIGFAYPAFASFKAIRSKEKEEATRWLIYWCSFSSFYLVDSLWINFVRQFPVYWVLKTTLLVLLWLPQAHGALLLYATFVDPAVSLFDNSIKSYLH